MSNVFMVNLKNTEDYGVRTGGLAEVLPKPAMVRNTLNINAHT